MKIRYVSVLFMWLCLIPAIASADDLAEKAAAAAAKSWLGQIDAGNYVKVGTTLPPTFKAP
jgi:hypothetical protein